MTVKTWEGKRPAKKDVDALLARIDAAEGCMVEVRWLMRRGPRGGYHFHNYANEKVVNYLIATGHLEWCGTTVYRNTRPCGRMFEETTMTVKRKS